MTTTILCGVMAAEDISVLYISAKLNAALDPPATRTPVPHLPNPSAVHGARGRRGREGRAGKGRAQPSRSPPPGPAARPPAQPAPRYRVSVTVVGDMGAVALSGALCLGLLWRLWAGAGGSCSERCCQGRDAACVSSGWREDGGYGTCYCDGGCRRTRDCCHDHGHACPGQCRGAAPSRAPGGITPRMAVSGLPGRSSLPLGLRGGLGALLGVSQPLRAVRDTSVAAVSSPGARARPGEGMRSMRRH